MTSNADQDDGKARIGGARGRRGSGRRRAASEGLGSMRWLIALPFLLIGAALLQPVAGVMAQPAGCPTGVTLTLTGPNPPTEPGRVLRVLTPELSPSGLPAGMYLFYFRDREPPRAG